MTLLMTLIGSDYTILLADRRLSSNGRLVDDESNKAGSVVMEDAKLAFAFTGVAKVGTFSTQDWLLDGLSECASPDFLSVPTLMRLRDRLSKEFSSNRFLGHLPLAAKPLAVLFAGYHFAPEGSYAVSAILTNFAGFAANHDLPFVPKDFVLREIRADIPSRVGFAGAWPAVTDSDVSELHKMLIAGKGAAAVLGKAIDVFHKVSDRAKARGTVGGQLNSVIIRADPRAPIESNYHVKNCSPISYVANFAVLTKDNGVLCKGGTIFPSDEFGRPRPGAPPMVVPKVHRNAPCPCGSKLKYRLCHGKAQQKQPSL